MRPPAFESDLGFAAVQFLYLIALAVWVGGMAVLAFVVTPTIFAQLERRQAGALSGRILRRFDTVIYGCLVVAIAMASIRALRYDAGTLASVIRYVMLVVMAGLALFSGTILARRIEAARPGDSADPTMRTRFARLHRLSVSIYMINMLLGAAVFFLS